MRLEVTIPQWLAVSRLGKSTSLGRKWDPWGVKSLHFEENSNITPVWSRSEASEVRIVSSQYWGWESQTPDYSTTQDKCGMYIFPITFFYLRPVLELQEQDEWSTICATHGRRSRRHHTVWALTNSMSLSYYTQSSRSLRWQPKVNGDIWFE